METLLDRSRFDRLIGYLAHDPSNLPLLQDASHEAMQLGLWREAHELLDRTLALSPTDAPSRYRMSVALMMEHDPIASLEYSQALIDEGVDAPAVLYQHARALILAGRHAEAEPLFERLAPHASELPEFALLHIRALHGAGKLDEAAALAATMEADPIAQGMLSLIRIDNDDLEAGAALAREVLAHDPDNVDALLASATAAVAMEDAEAALPQFERVAALHADSGRAWMGIALARLSAGDIAGGREAFEKTVRLLPGHLGSWNALAWVQMMQNDLDAAQETLEAAMRQDRNFGETHGTLAVLLASRGQWDEARHETDIALRLQPESFAGRFAQTLIIEHRGRPQLSQQMLRQIMENFHAPAGGNMIDVVRRYAARRKPALSSAVPAAHSSQKETR
ncbi:tetratricopeptide repeat protein [Noviherbaspirillum pedocola]|uniref:Tetratricopeptide repeat protein n=1 Tax=Noviherbaspirillum pedocola TaxID=2801341 RepID=A0A934SV18_9BURK|nr:tetratricopeptide repeat protein [Noviherbaspirillum pedocola]MBK4735681.1 tetratricopeptide repeat protein [Noviherbaspirillum pedocola]